MRSAERQKCRCKIDYLKTRYKVWEVYNDRILLKKNGPSSVVKCIYCWSTKNVTLINNCKCQCRMRKKSFDKMCKEYSHIKDCVPAQPTAYLFKDNLQAVTAYMKQNKIQDMKISELNYLINNDD